MLLGRLIGWTFICAAILIASGEAVLALGTGSYDGLAAREVWILLSGSPTPDPNSVTASLPFPPMQIADQVHAVGVLSTLAAVGSALWATMLDWPAWMVIGPFGFLLVTLCRPRRKHHASYREQSFS